MSEVLEAAALLKNPTPMMKQYLDVKAEYQDYILLYRLGDFFECFFEDAMSVSAALELTLTGRDCGEGCRAAMCGVPFHKVDVYIGKLVEKGYKVAVCEQTENPAEAKGIVRREVVRIVTPGTVTDGELLDGTANNYLSAIAFTEDVLGVAFADISTGQVFATSFSGEDALLKLQNELTAYAPREVVVNARRDECAALSLFLEERFGTMISEGGTELFDPRTAERDARDCFGEDASALHTPALLLSVGALLSYIRKTQKCDPSFARELSVYQNGQYMELDFATRRNLELFEAMRTKEKKGSLLWVLDKTKTAMGARCLRNYLLHPLLSVSEIRLRQGAVSNFVSEYLLRQDLRAVMGGIADLERLMAKVAYGSANARDLKAIADAIQGLPELLSLLSLAESERLRALARDFDTLSDLYELLDAAIADTPPLTVREGGMIKDGYHADVDYLRNIGENAKGWIKEIEAKERELTGIKTLKVGDNKIFGYYIEVTRSFLEMVPDRYIRKQTLTGCERFITQELKEMEGTVLGAADKLSALEYDLFVEIRERLAAASSRVQETAARIAEIDVYLSLAEVAAKQRYVCPEVDDGEEIRILEGRHPVVEKFMPDSYFVPNDTRLDRGINRLYLITGPNMAGKSTYMRQVALITLMAQIGSFVPAKEATIGIADKLFTRVGASDDLASGQSTFMLEMIEVASILKNATPRSFIIYDEVGRGTSTYDGMAIAKAVVEYTAKKLRSRTLFATHYHELTEMEGVCDGVINYHVVAKKRKDDIVFLRKIVKGATDDSYGIEVAKLAGVPSEVVKRAKEVLAEIESKGEPASAPRKPSSAEDEFAFDMMSAIRSSQGEEIAERLRETDLNTMTPLECMTLLFELKKLLK